MNKKLDFKMSIKEFNERCISNGQVAAEFDLRPVDMATKDGVSWNIETKDNEVYFYKVDKMEKVKYIRLVLPVRYDEEDMPNYMPFRNGNVFDITYDIKSGDIVDFMKDAIDFKGIISWNNLEDRVSANMLEDHYIFMLDDMKVADKGKYYLLDENLNILYSLEEEYVPDSHSVHGEYGDYINLHIDLKNGKILNLKQNATFQEFKDKRC